MSGGGTCSTDPATPPDPGTQSESGGELQVQPDASRGSVTSPPPDYRTGANGRQQVSDDKPWLFPKATSLKRLRLLFIILMELCCVNC